MISTKANQYIVFLSIFLSALLSYTSLTGQITSFDMYDRCLTTEYGATYVYFETSSSGTYTIEFSGGSSFTITPDVENFLTLESTLANQTFEVYLDDSSTGVTGRTGDITDCLALCYPDVSLTYPLDQFTTNDTTSNFYRWNTNEELEDYCSITEYELQVDNSVQFDNPVIHISDRTRKELTLTPGTYFWRVRATDDMGNHSTNWSTIRTVYVNSTMPTCSDGIQNGDETGIDCGGTTCDPCPCDHPDFDALMALYDSTDGPNWTNKSGWEDGASGTDCDPCNWHGITCNNGRVLAISLADNQMSGAIPAAFGDLTFLDSFVFEENNITSLPSSIGQLNNLRKIYLLGNAIPSLPPEIGNLQNLRKLNLASNNISTIPSEIGQLSNLILVAVEDNSLSALPAEIGQLSSLEDLYAGANTITSIPTEFGQLSNLRQLFLDGNAISTIPAEIGNLTLLQSLGLNSNSLTSIPAEIGNLSNLLNLYLSNNSISTILTDFSELQSLATLQLDNNQLTEAPNSVAALMGLGYYSFSNNQISCYPVEYEVLCHNPNLVVETGGNNGLPSWTDFCNTSVGLCGGMPTCSDGIQNGDETGVDCGGTICDPCAIVDCAETDYILMDDVYDSTALHVKENLEAESVLYQNDLTLKAGHSIKLNPGFETKTQTTLSANIEECPDETVSFIETSTGITLTSAMTSNSYHILPVELNNDNHTDIVFRYHEFYGADTKILIYINDGLGGYNAPVTYTGSYSHSSLRDYADLNNDGYNDIIVSCNFPSSARIYLNNGDGTLQTESAYTLTDYSNGIEVADMDGDGFKDLISLAGNASIAENTISILSNKGDGTFDPQVTTNTAGFGRFIAPADLDGDNDIDIVYGTGHPSFGGPQEIRTYMNDGNGNLTLHHTADNSGLYSMYRKLHDFNQDGLWDLPVVSNGIVGLRLGTSNYNYDFSNISSLENMSYPYTNFDINLDGHTDFFIDKENQVSLWGNDGTGNFTNTIITIDIGRLQTGHLPLDMDNDGDMDILYITNNQVFIAKNQLQK